MSAGENKAVFLSYASQDAEAARRICDTLRAAGVEVWFDQSELRGGDAWDAKIRKQIKECALFVPVISANTQARAEGYFRIEWRLADRRTEAIGKSKAFLLPVCIDDTRDSEADVPDSFLGVQWTRLPGGEPTAAFCQRVPALLNGKVSDGLRARLPEIAHSGRTQVGRASRRIRAFSLAGLTIALLATLAIWRPWQRVATQSNLPIGSDEVSRLRARLIPARWQKVDYEPMSAALDRIIQSNPENAEAWALRSIINSLQVIRSYDAGTQPLEIGKAAADRALHLAPGAALSELALGLHLTAMLNRGGDVSAALPHIRRAVAGLPRDALTRYAELVSLWLGYQFDEVQRAGTTWLAEEPGATFPAWILGQVCVTTRRVDEAERWAEIAATDNDLVGLHALDTLFNCRYYLRADLAGARRVLERASSARFTHRLYYAQWVLTMAEQRYDDALQQLARCPDAMLFARHFHGPKALLGALAHQAAGRSEAATAVFGEAERLLRAELSRDPDNQLLRASLALTLACAGRANDARTELATLEPLVRGRAPNSNVGQLCVSIAQTYGALGDIDKMLPWLRQVLSEPGPLPFTPASLRVDARFRSVIAAPQVQALLMEFAHLDTAKSAVPAGPAKSIAVLPFKSVGGDAENEIFAEGISDELISVLGRLPGLRVAARMSSFANSIKGARPQQIGHELGVSYLIEGRVQRASGRVRITAQLINAADGFAIWDSGSLERELKDVWAVQDEIVGLIAQNLSLTLGAPLRASRAVNPEAHRLVLEARHYLRLRTDDSNANAEKTFLRAVAVDPDFAPAHSGLAEVYAVRATYAVQDGASEIAMVDIIRRARSEASLAISLDATLAEAYAISGHVLTQQGLFRDAEREFEKAERVNPNDAMVFTWRSVLRMAQGRLDDGLRDQEKAEQLDPLWPISLAMHGESRLYARQFQLARVKTDRLVALRPENWVPNLGAHARILWALGERDGAIETARQVRLLLGRKEPRRDADAAAVWVLAQAGLQQEAREFADEAMGRLAADSYQRGFVLGALGRFEQALPHLEHTPPVPRRRLFWDPMWDRWRQDRRFLELMAKLGCEAEYETARASLARVLRQ